ncbi:chemotaxis protein CheW [Candidatus Magnetobacterium bavaricum]|uniref:Chemotaxis protein CheW n=1 Tax=Candidatus Magnetobacterium bavaricum TaxID=29290 RepID=A0A0F3GXJ9_9BACT|nr:chemotaxis protein CheW [Candidatus Magnetobacterium bavaricum]
MEAFTVTDGVLQLVTFTLGSEEYAIDILKVQEINRMTVITMVPNSPQYVEGVINLRGKVIPVINLRKKFGISEIENDTDARIMIVDIKGITMGMVVDSVSEVLRVPATIVEATPPMATDISTEFINGIAKLADRLIILLDIDKLIEQGEMSVF